MANAQSGCGIVLICRRFIYLLIYNEHRTKPMALQRFTSARNSGTQDEVNFRLGKTKHREKHGTATSNSRHDLTRHSRATISRHNYVAISRFSANGQPIDPLRLAAEPGISRHLEKLHLKRILVAAFGPDGLLLQKFHVSPAAGMFTDLPRWNANASPRCGLSG